MVRTLICLASLTALSACSGGGGGDDDTTGDTGKDGNYNYPYCEETVTDLALDDATELGFAPSALVELADGAHTATMTWADGTHSEATLTVALQTTARFVDLEPVYPTTGTVPDIAVICEDYVAIDGTLDLTTDDGRLAESLSLTFQSATGLEVTARSELDPAGLSGSLVFDDFVRSTDYDERSMWVDALFDATGSHGRVEGQVTGGDDCQDGDVCTQWAEVVDLGSWGYELD